MFDRQLRWLTFAFTALAILGLSATDCQADGPKHEEAVIVHFQYGQKDWAPFFAFEKTLQDAIDKSGVGEYDGNELANSGADGYLYMYGPDADALLKFIKPRLLEARILKEIEVELRYGAANDPSVRISTIHLTR